MFAPCSITITDGEPTGPGERMETTRNVIIRAKEYLSTLPYGAGSIAFMFAQVQPANDWPIWRHRKSLRAYKNLLPSGLPTQTQMPLCCLSSPHDF